MASKRTASSVSCCTKSSGEPNVRGSAVGVSSLSNWAANFTIALLFPILTAALGQAPVFWGLGVICILSMVFVYFIVPETAGRSLEEIEADLRQGVTVNS